MTSCQRFLQLRYHNEGEFLPDRFDFEGNWAAQLWFMGLNLKKRPPRLSDEDESDAGCQMSKEDLA